MSETEDWRKICTDCQEGEPPKDCEYFGEPNGCNSPTYGKHPTCKESLQVGNAAKMREALMEIQLVCWKAGGTMGYDVACGIIKSKSHAALSATVRNCDRYPDFCSAILAFEKDRPNTKKKWDMERYCLFAHWLFDEAKGEGKCKKKKHRQ